MLWLPLILAVTGAVFIGIGRTYGWVVAVCVMLGPLFLGFAFLCYVFPETRVLSYPLGLSGLLLVAGGGITGFMSPIARARRIYEREQRRAEEAQARNFLAKRQQARNR